MHPRYAYDHVVITGGPCCGKSSVIRELSARGHDTVPEAARVYFDQKISEGYTADEARDNFDFMVDVFEKQLEMESHARDGETTFYDRGLGDSIVYGRREMMPAKDFFHLCFEAQDRYDVVFLLEPVPFKNDDVRTETEEEAREIHTEIREAYEMDGYEVIDVPLMPVDERADFITARSHWQPPIR